MIKRKNSTRTLCFSQLALLKNIGYSDINKLALDRTKNKEGRTTVIKFENVSFSYDNQAVLEGVTFTINHGDRIGLVGPNGAGKTTLLKLIMGDIYPTIGNVGITGDNIGYLPQDLTPWQDYSVVDYLREITGITAAERELEEASALGVAGGDRTESAINQLESLGADTFDARVKTALAKTQLQDIKETQKIKTLSGGQKTRLGLTAIFVDKHSTLLLDEPTNNLDMEGLALLENFLCQSKNSLVIVSHDRRFLQKIATKIVALDKDAAGVEVYNLGYEEYVKAREVKRESIRLTHERFLDEKDRLKQAYLSKNRDSVAADKNKKKTDNEKMAWHAVKEKAVGAHASAAHALKTRGEKLETPEVPKKKLDLNFRLGTSHRSGDMVVQLNGATITFDGSDKTIGPFDLTIQRGDHLIITGPNGSGKSTLLKLILGDLKPTLGTVTLGVGVKSGLVDQDHSMLCQDKTVLDCVTEMVNKNTTPPMGQSEIRQILAMFNFDAEKVFRLVKELSPGEQSRVLLAALVARDTNVLVLDEPTNHLDIDASEELEDAISSYRGTYIIVTHDREFIDNIKPNRTVRLLNGLIA